MHHFIMSLYSKFPQLHYLDVLSTDPMRAFIIELSLFTIILCLFHHRRAQLFQHLLMLASTAERSNSPATKTDLGSPQIASFELRIKALERRLEAMNHDMTSLVEHLMSHPGEPLRVKRAANGAANGAGLQSTKG